MADYELVAGTVLQFPMSVSCQRNLAYKVLKHPLLRAYILIGLGPVFMIHENKKKVSGLFQTRT